MLEEYVVLDLEMTGLSAKEDRIIEIAALHIKNGMIYDRYETLVNPGCAIPQRIQELTGITNEMVQGQMLYDEAVFKLLEFVGDRYIVGHNVIFDYSFMKQWAVNHKRKLDLYAYDTLKMARQCLPKEQSKTLEALCEYFKINRPDSHRAMADTMATWELFQCLLQLFQREHVNIRKPTLLQYRAKKQTPATKSQIEQIERYRAVHRVTEEIDWEILTRSRASQIMEYYYKTYGR